MNRYTVILLYPEYLCHEVPFGQAIYIAYVTADTKEEAIDVARQQAFGDSHTSTYTANAPSDFKFVLLLCGWIDVGMTQADRGNAP